MLIVRIVVFAAIFVLFDKLGAGAVSNNWVLLPSLAAIAALAAAFEALFSARGMAGFGKRLPVWLAISGLSMNAKLITHHIVPDLAQTAFAIVPTAWELARLGNNGFEGVVEAMRSSRFFAIASSELRALRYAIIPPGTKAYLAAGSTAYLPTNDMVAGSRVFLVLAILESVVFHLLLYAVTSKTFLFVCAVVSDVFIIYSIGIIRSISRVPTTISGDDVDIRVGILFHVAVKKHELLATTHLDKSGKAGFVNGALLSSPNIYVLFSEPQYVTILGILKKKVRGMTLKLRAHDAFMSQLT